MTADIEMLPLPEMEPFATHGSLKKWASDYARAVAEHNVAARDAEIEALRAEVERLQAEIDNRWAQGVHTCHDKCQRIACVLRRQRDFELKRAERLAEALREKADKWDRIGDEHGVRQFTGNDHKLFANELRALLRDHDQEGK